MKRYPKYKDSGVKWIGEIPEYWECVPLFSIANSFVKGQGITKDQVYADGDIQCVRYGEVYTKYNIAFNACESKTRLNEISNPTFFSKGDVLFTCTGELVEEIGKSVVYMGDDVCLAGGDTIVMKHSQDPKFLGMWDLGAI